MEGYTDKMELLNIALQPQGGLQKWLQDAVTNKKSSAAMVYELNSLAGRCLVSSNTIQNYIKRLNIKPEAPAEVAA